MLTATLTDDGHVAIPEAIRRQYGWTGGVKYFITPVENGIMFSETKPTKHASYKTPVEEWKMPEPKLRGSFLAPVEEWRELANERPLFSDDKKPSNTVTLKKAREELDGLFDRVSRTRQPVKIRGKNKNAFLISQEDFDGIVGTLELNAIPGMVESILEGGRTPHEECIPFEELGWDLKSN